MRLDDDAIEAGIVRLLCARAPDASICPSEVARALAPIGQAWRATMPRVRVVARRMTAEGRIRMTQRDTEIDPEAPARGPIRLKRGPRFPEGPAFNP